MEKPELVSIILAVYNGQKYLKEQIASIINQSYRDIELVIIDDNSQDESLNIANEAAAIDSRIKVYKNPHNLGVVANFLKAVSYAKGKFICFSDQDDYWRKDRIEILVRLLEKNEENMMAYSDIEICDENLQPIQSSLGFNETRLKKGYLRELSFLKNITPHMMFRKKVGDAMSTVSDKPPFIHDHLALVLSAGLGRIVYTKEKLVKYRQHSGNEIGAFYPSVINKDKIIRELTQKIEYFRSTHFQGLKLDLDRMEGFCECLRGKGFFRRLSFFDCYLFLRNNTLSDKALGCLECLFPEFYNWMRERKNK